MQTIISNYLRSINKSMEGILVFGSALEPSWNSKYSDLDIVLFCKEDSFKHYIDTFQNVKLDIFEMSLERAFYFLTKRDPMWLSAFSTGKIIKGDEHTELLLNTASKIVSEQKPQLSKLQVNRLLLELDSSYQKLCLHQSNQYIYLHFSHHFLNCLAACLFAYYGIPAMGMAKQVDYMTEQLPEFSPYIQQFLLVSNITKKHQLTEQLYQKAIGLFNHEINYPITISQKVE